MHTRRFVLLVSLLVLSLSLTACGAATTDGEEASEDDVTTSTAVFTPDLEWLEGEWIAATTLTYIDNPVLTPAADQPMAEWVCEVDGSTMYMVTGEHTYEGVLSSDDGIAWRYVASSSYTDEDGIVWTSDIDITGTKTGEGFEAEMDGEISSDTDGHLYSATWSVTATPMNGE